MVRFDDKAQGSNGKRKRGLVIGELLVALLLLAVAVSSLAALMYSVSRRPTTEPITCAGKVAGSSGSCADVAKSGVASKFLKTGCTARVGASDRTCKDIDLGADSSGEMIIRSRTDSASLAMIEKKQNETRAPRRPDRGFIR
ncbi:MAG TPA: hypothetical protein VGO33_15665 [Gemmatimonadaceae bacterium]|jgi:hypothetical protein|nr:hypothetical protein [Gemmatimonadaceae bacterium]